MPRINSETKIFLITLLTLVFLVAPSVVKANDEEIICPQPYGGGVVCGVKTHEPVETGLGENLAMVGAGLLASSSVFLIISKKLKSSHV